MMMSLIDDRNCRPIVSDDNPYSEAWQGNAGKVMDKFKLTLHLTTNFKLVENYSILRQQNI